MRGIEIGQEMIDGKVVDVDYQREDSIGWINLAKRITEPEAEQLINSISQNWGTGCVFRKTPIDQKA